MARYVQWVSTEEYDDRRFYRVHIERIGLCVAKQWIWGAVCFVIALGAIFFSL